MADDKEETPEVEAAIIDEAVIDEAIMDETKEEKDEPKVVSSNQSETLKAIVDFVEETSDMNTELFKSTIRTTPLDSEKRKVNVDQLLNPDGPNIEDKNVKSEEAKAKKNVEKQALKAARDSADEEEEELDVYQGIEEKKESEWTIVRCTSSEDNISVEDTIEGEDKPDSKMEEEKNSVDEVRDDSDEDKSFEIIDGNEVEDCKDGDHEEVTETEKDSGSKLDGVIKDAGVDKKEDKSRTDEDVKDENGDNLYEVTGFDLNKFKAKTNNDDGEEKKIDLEVAEEESLGDKSTPTSPTDEGKEFKEMDVDEDDKEKEEAKDEFQKEEPMDIEESKKESETSEDTNRNSLSEFDDIQGSGILDTHAQKSRARLAKTGVLAQRRKPPRSSWYVEDGQKTQEFMFTDSTEPKPLKQVKEEESPVPSPRTAPKVATRKLPPGAKASPLLLPGLGANFKLKKTTSSEPSSKSQAGTKSPPGIKSPTAAKVLPSQKFGPRVLPVPAKRQPAAHSKGKAPSPPEGKATVTPVKPQRNRTEEKVLSPKEPSPSSTVGQFKLPPPSAAKPTVKPRPKPLPKPRPQSIAGTSEPVVQKDAKVNRTSKDDLNSDILNGQKSPASPRWTSDKNKRLPPISPITKTGNDSTNLFQIPKWKQDLLKKKKEAEVAGYRRSIVPPPLPKKDEDPTKAPFTTVPQWQLELAKKKKMKKGKDEESQEDGVSRHPKEPKTEDSNKVEQENRKKPLLSPKPAIVPRKFEAVPRGKDTTPSWQKNLQDKKKNNEKNLLIENGEKKDTEKLAVISPSSKKDAPFISSPSYNSKVPHWKLELEKKNAKLFQRFHQNEME